MRDKETGEGSRSKKSLQPLDGSDVEMVGGFVQEQKVRFLSEGTTEQDTTAKSARECVERCVRLQT